MKSKSSGIKYHKVSFSPGEESVLYALADGETRAEYAARKGISVGTVQNSIRLIIAKTHSKTMAQALCFALKSGAIS